MAVPLVPGPGLGDANAAQKSMSTLLKNQCDFCAVLIEPKQETAAARGRRPMGPRSRAQALGQATDRACVQRAKEAPGCQVEGQRALTGIGRRT